MKKIMIWTAGGFGLAAICGFAQLAYLSATLITLTVFCATPALLVVVVEYIASRLRNGKHQRECGLSS